ncbi:MAG: hypothetical protein ABW130_20460, partial [Candidatus Thiodiazotropha lotti]
YDLFLSHRIIAVPLTFSLTRTNLKAPLPLRERGWGEGVREAFHVKAKAALTFYFHQDDSWLNDTVYSPPLPRPLSRKGRGELFFPPIWHTDEIRLFPAFIPCCTMLFMFQLPICKKS